MTVKQLQQMFDFNPRGKPYRRGLTFKEWRGRIATELKLLVQI